MAVDERFPLRCKRKPSDAWAPPAGEKPYNGVAVIARGPLQALLREANSGRRFQNSRVRTGTCGTL